MFLLVTLLQPQGLRSTLSVVHSLLHHLSWRAWVWPRENSPDWDKGAQKSPQECLIRMGFADCLYRHMQYSSLDSWFGLRSLHVRHWRSGFQGAFLSQWHRTTASCCQVHAKDMVVSVLIFPKEKAESRVSWKVPTVSARQFRLRKV